MADGSSERRTGLPPDGGLRVAPVATVPGHGGPVLPVPGPEIRLRLCGNLGSVPPPSLWSRLAADLELVRAYPTGNELQQRLAARHGVAPEQIVVGAGADELLDRLCRAVLAPGRVAIVPVPTFEMIERYVRLAGAAVAAVPWIEGAWPRSDVLAAVTPATALVAIVSPNNPTGLTATAADVAAVADAVPGALVVVDGAYAEYAGSDLDAVAVSRPNTVLVRTFSKAFGLAGLRVGYAVAHPTVARWLRAVGSPFTAGRLAQKAAALRLDDEATDVAAHVRAVAEHRRELTDLLERLAARPLPSRANFVFARVADPGLVQDVLASLGISVRAFEYPGLAALPGGVRITVPAPADWWRWLASALECALQPAAILLDLDGVLADVEGRRALATADEVAALAAFAPVGVVTGCPHRLCASVLERHGFAPHVRTVVAAEDGPGKPDPRPVRLAMERLGASCAWMLGDNVADVRAARAAGIVPFAITPGGPDAEARGARLLAAGAARLLGGVGALAALLPRR